MSNCFSDARSFSSGCRVFTTCSAHNKELVKSRGSDEWFDYSLPDCYERVNDIGASITYLLDCIGSEESSIFCSKVLAPTGGHYHSIKAPLPKAFKASRPETTAIATTAFAYSMTGERFEFPGMEFAADVAQGQFAKKWRDIAEDLVARRKIQPHPVVTRKGGLHGVINGLNEIRSRAPRGHKIVYSRDP